MTVDLVLLAIAGFMFWASLDHSEVARRAPLVILGVLIPLVLLDLAMTVGKALTGRGRSDRFHTRIDAPGWYQAAHIGGFVACGLLIYYLGYRLATPVFLTVFLLAMRVRLRVLVPLVAGVSLFVYVIFSEILRLR